MSQVETSAVDHQQPVTPIKIQMIDHEFQTPKPSTFSLNNEQKEQVAISTLIDDRLPTLIQDSHTS